jgi:hypothetical protein
VVALPGGDVCAAVELLDREAVLDRPGELGAVGATRVSDGVAVLESDVESEPVSDGVGLGDLLGVELVRVWSDTCEGAVAGELGRTAKYSTRTAANSADSTSVDVRAVTCAAHHSRALTSWPPNSRPRPWRPR